jgi:hypothetical protein
MALNRYYNKGEIEREDEFESLIAELLVQPVDEILQCHYKEVMCI